MVAQIRDVLELIENLVRPDSAIRFGSVGILVDTLLIASGGVGLMGLKWSSIEGAGVGPILALVFACGCILTMGLPILFEAAKAGVRWQQQLSVRFLERIFGGTQGGGYSYSGPVYPLQSEMQNLFSFVVLALLNFYTISDQGVVFYVVNVLSSHPVWLSKSIVGAVIIYAFLVFSPE